MKKEGKKMLEELFIILFVIILTIIFIGGIIAVIVVCLKPEHNQEYEESTYYKMTSADYIDTYNDKGSYGEYLIYKNLKPFEDIGCRFMFNLYIPVSEDKTTEIDIILITQKGIYVIESKNYSGYIFGNIKSQYWYQTLHIGYGKTQKVRFYNPVKQNENHINFLKKVVGENIPMHSIVVFSERCDFKNLKLNDPNVSVIHREFVYETVYNKENKYFNILSQEQIDSIYNSLLKYAVTSEDVKIKHSEDVVEAKYKSAERYQTHGRKCPKCDRYLIKKRGKYGYFYACPNYPNCTYTEQIQKDN